ncbi:glycosyltransferase family 4 protein [Solwaraspora sp. WMMD406]|uniref:glycosyltransferase family 4 protein n=1 Tax=Solwaraspora sp. WMMD406 TaxID=3016095 RepID=UPI00241812C8|nr:glycosyltransferase family 4 protein [Solwaraspora sp. WMMD406]MDG4766080.1 glycosyltransferase family 4 protein [Solwaraspora sp. WMMD406]
MERLPGSATGVVAVTTENRLQRTPDGAVWTVAGPAHSFWTRYLSAFERVRLLARVADVSTPPAGASRVDGLGVQVWPLPSDVGPTRYLPRRRALRRAVRDAVDDVEAVVLRVPSPIAAVTIAILRRQQRGYAVEVIGDPYDIAAPGTADHPLRPLSRRRAVRKLREQCHYATGAAYVTETHLQNRYPPGPHTVTVWYPSVDLRPDAFATRPRPAPTPGDPVTLICVAALDEPDMGLDVALVAVRRLVDTGTDVRLVHVGDGRFRPRLERMTLQQGLSDRVTFTGNLPATEVRAELDAADLFVLPSRTDDLSRALIEAMARGLPAIATPVSGMPELLSPDCLVPPGDPVALADAIRRLLDEPALLATAAERNLARSRDYRAEILAPRRAAFYRTVRLACRPAAVEPASPVREHASAN